MRIAAAIVAAALAASAQSPTTVTLNTSYLDWGWDSVYVMDNGLISLAVVPDIGGRMLQYSLGAHLSMWIDNAYKGATYPSDPGST